MVCIPIVFVFLVFYRDISLLILHYTVFTCAAMTMNFLNLLSECGVISCDYILHYYVCGYELVCEVVNYYHSL